MIFKSCLNSNIIDVQIYSNNNDSLKTTVLYEATLMMLQKYRDKADRLGGFNVPNRGLSNDPNAGSD